jgi:hypothetical protein
MVVLLLGYALVEMAIFLENDGLSSAPAAQSFIARFLFQV